jgi:lipopolysaccharide export system protein LptA
MVKIRFLRFLQVLVPVRHILYVSVLLLFAPALYSQVNSGNKTGRKMIELKNADEDLIVKDLQTGALLHHFKGNLKFIQNITTMWCDSAHFSQEKNQLTAFSRVHIAQGDTLNLFGDYLFYDGTSEIAIVKGNVELIDKDTHLFTDSINYDVKNKVARYTDHGKITNAKNILTSIIGVYYVSDNLFHFKDSVKIVNPDYVVTADTMDYNTKSEIAYFTGPTKLVGDSLNLYCEKGWYDTRKDITTIWHNAVIDNHKQVIHGDSLFYNNNIGFGEAFNNVVITDTTNNMIIQGNYAWYYKQPEKFLVTNRAMFIQVSDKDSLFMHADTISAITVADTTKDGYRLMRAYHGCRIYSKSFQSRCDSLTYSLQDSVIRFYREPVIWSEENQLTSDSMAIFTKNRKTDRLELYNSAFITSQIDTIRFNQIKGKNLTSFFKNNEIYKIDIKGNGETIYYLLDGEDIAGVNQGTCVNIEVYVEKGKVSEIYEFQQPEGTIDPPDPGRPIELRLKGFNWFNSLRPKQKSDIFIK